MGMFTNLLASDSPSVSSLREFLRVQECSRGWLGSPPLIPDWADPETGVSLPEPV